MGFGIIGCGRPRWGAIGPAAGVARCEGTGTEKPKPYASNPKNRFAYLAVMSRSCAEKLLRRDRYRFGAVVAGLMPVPGRFYAESFFTLEESRRAGRGGRVPPAQCHRSRSKPYDEQKYPRPPLPR